MLIDLFLIFLCRWKWMYHECTFATSLSRLCDKLGATMGLFLFYFWIFNGQLKSKFHGTRCMNYQVCYVWWYMYYSHHYALTTCHLHACLHMKIVMFVLLSFINMSLHLAFSFLLSQVIPRPPQERESWLVLCDCILHGALHICCYLLGPSSQTAMW